MNKKGHTIKSVDSGSIADALELQPGDRLLSVNGNEIEDIFDYEYYVDSPSLTLLVEKPGWRAVGAGGGKQITRIWALPLKTV